MRRSVVIGGLVALVIAVALVAWRMGRRSVDQPPAAGLGEALVRYHLERGRLPTTQEGLAVLMVPRGGRQRFVATPPTDPWGSPYLYLGPDVFGEAKAALWSMGPDRLPNTVDDEVHLVQVGDSRQSRR